MKNPRFLIFNLAFLIALVSGILMGLTVAPVGAWFLAWIALVPLWVLVVATDVVADVTDRLSVIPKVNPSVTSVATDIVAYITDRLSVILKVNPSVTSVRPSVATLSFAWGIGYHGVALSWITGIHPMTWMGVPWLASLAIALFCWTFITLWGAALVAIWAIVMRAIFIQNPYIRVLIGVALWCGLEGLWSAGPLYWSSLSYTQSPHNLVILHLGQLSGPSAVTAAIVAVNGLIAEAWINRQDAKDAKIFSASLATAVAYGGKPACSAASSWRFVNKYLAIAGALFITCHLMGFGLYTRPIAQPPEAALKVGIIQGNVPNQIKLYPEGFRRAIEGYTSGYLTLADQGVDAVLTPEGALPFSEDDIMRSSLVAAVREKGVVAWIGGFDKHGNNYTNSLFTFSSNGEIKSRYGKVKMVPIGEYIPFEAILGGIVKRLSPLDEHQVAGPSNQVFDTPFGRAIVGICYESAFAELFRHQAAAGGEFILSASNDAHYSAAMPAQHHAQDVMRAIETDRWAVRATNTGYSAFVNPHGRTRWISGHNTYEVHAETIYRRQTQTLFVRWDDWLTPLLLILGALAWCLNK